MLNALDIPACSVNAVQDLFEDPHLRAVEFFEEHQHPTGGRLEVCRFPVRFSASPASLRRLAPGLGEHNEQIFGRKKPRKPRQVEGA